MFVSLLDAIVQGVLVGGLYALFALGLSLSVGIMRSVNIAHGDFIVLASFGLLTLSTQLGVNVWVALAMLIPIAFAAGYALQRGLMQRVRGNPVLAPLLVTFGLAIIIQNSLQEGYGSYPRLLQGGGLETATLALGPVNVGVLPLLTFIVAIALIVALDLLLFRSPIGSSIRAVADDVDAARLVGLSSAHIYAIAMGLIGVTVAIAAAFMGLRMNFDAVSGPTHLLTAFEAVVLGGVGNLWGTLAGGIVLGVAQAIGGQIDVAYQNLAGHVVFLIVVFFRPQGLFPKN